MMKPVAGEAKMNKAEGHNPKSGHDAPAAAHKGKSADAGSERKANMAGAMSNSVGGHSGASEELRRQHPHAYDDHGPHHNDKSHLRHQPMRMR
jgi:hypothetical protein